MALIGNDISKAKSCLQANNLVGIPTETVYGLAANAFNDEAVIKIFKAKNRPFFDPLIVHTSSLERLKEFVEFIPTPLEILIKKFSPGPITVLLPKKKNISDLVTSGLERMAVRIPNHPLTLELLRSLPFPLAAPSANPFGYISPTSAQHVENQLGKAIAYILDGGECEIGLESTIVGMENDKVTIYRKGGLSIEAIEELVGPVILKEHSSSNPAAPGMLKSHYAPNKSVISKASYEKIEDKNILGRIGFLGFSKKLMEIDGKNQFLLSAEGDVNEAGQNLFKGLRFLDELPIDTVVVEYVPDIGLGRAINDRLKRATA